MLFPHTECPGVEHDRFTTGLPRRGQEQERRMPLRMRVHDREPIGMALRRFKKLLERSGIQKELRKRKYYEKPCEARRRAELRKQSAIRKANRPGPPRPARARA